MIYFTCQCLFLNAPAGGNILLHLILIFSLWNIQTISEEDQIKTTMMRLVLCIDYFFFFLIWRSFCEIAGSEEG